MNSITQDSNLHSNDQNESGYGCLYPVDTTGLDLCWKYSLEIQSVLVNKENLIFQNDFVTKFKSFYVILKCFEIIINCLSDENTHRNR